MILRTVRSVVRLSAPPEPFFFISRARPSITTGMTVHDADTRVGSCLAGLRYFIFHSYGKTRRGLSDRARRDGQRNIICRVSGSPEKNAAGKLIRCSSYITPERRVGDHRGQSASSLCIRLYT